MRALPLSLCRHDTFLEAENPLGDFEEGVVAKMLVKPMESNHTVSN